MRPFESIGEFRDLFEGIFEHYVGSNFVTFEDVVFPMRYYVRIMREDKALYEEYMAKYHLERARGFLRRFPVWNAEQPLVVV